MSFESAFTRLIDVEKGFQADPRDRGNWTGGEPGRGLLKGTKFGISAAAYPSEDIEHLTLERAQLLYRRDYWARPAATPCRTA
jgi:lysozyme family protein